MVQQGPKTDQGHRQLQKKKETSVVLHGYEVKMSGENNLKQDEGRWNYLPGGSWQVKEDKCI